MANKFYPSQQAFIKRVRDFAKNNIKIKDKEIFLDFLKLFFSHVDPTDFNGCDLSKIVQIALCEWRYIQCSNPDDINIRILNPTIEEDGFESTHTIIQGLIRDMPFILDSIQMELNRLGYTIHFMVYTGGCQVCRDAKHKIKAIYPHGGELCPDGEFEAPVYMEIDKQTLDSENEVIRTNLIRVLRDVKAAVTDWQAMRKRMQESISEIANQNLPQKPAEIAESKLFLEWLLDDHFTFLGVRDYEVIGKGDKQGLHLVHDSGLGVLRDDSKSKVNRLFAEFPEQARELILSKEHLLIISKTNTRSTVHRSAYTDYIGVKRFNEQGELVGERRFIGLFTSTAYHSLPSEIPFLRLKVASILKRSKLPLRSHAGKDLINILSLLPRDDLFQASFDDLYHLSMGILYLQERRCIRIFVRRDAYNRYVSCLLYIPKENFNTRVLRSVGKILMETFSGLEMTFNTDFSGSILASIHFDIRIDPNHKLRFSLSKLQERVVEVGQSWADRFKKIAREHYGDAEASKIVAKYLHTFPAGYREHTDCFQAIRDVTYMEKLGSDDDLEMSIYHSKTNGDELLQFKLFQQNNSIALSDVLPILENMGLRIIREQPYYLKLDNGSTIWINDFAMKVSLKSDLGLEEIKEIFKQAFYRVWVGHAENDKFNQLVLKAGLNWQQIALLRAYTKYLKQTGFTFSLEYIADTFLHNTNHALMFIKLFYQYFSPHSKVSKSDSEKLEAEYIESLEQVSILDEDRILRRFIDFLNATNRTSYFQLDKNDAPKLYISLKLNPTMIPDLPLPLPHFEIFVYAARFEGVHLRAHKVARGGLRWSDRKEDFRTEVLGLMKAQQVKNAVIVPSGAKGGFVAKNITVKTSREEMMKEGIACYRAFINGLLDVTDNLVKGKVKSPKNTICYDEDDAYLVVAADKGTATFSDIANEIALSKNYWLGDAFASGGSQGYDHKKMGITAKGAWVSAERQFQELGLNVDQTEITVVGIGDMSGDVFGNGVLLSDKIKLVAAFNHQHIFIDPNPNPAKSFIERKRLFALPRSGWNDYDEALISQGGGVFSRASKSIPVSPEMKQLFGIDEDKIVPNELLKAILKAPVDLLWNGGIGTFVKSTQENNIEVGDRTNDLIRINGNELRTRVVCEGGNLGVTQLGRIEYELNGGKINTDFIDNSAGVDCSDHEVNIKILLNDIVERRGLDERQRNRLLANMTEEVSSLVLQNNYHQNEVLGLSLYTAHNQLPLFIHYMEYQFEKGLINRQLEFLPSKDEILERKAQGLGLTKPELSVLLAYEKINLEDRIRHSELPDDPLLGECIFDTFPTILRKKYAKDIQNHKLRREIISTQLSNSIVTDMGITFVYRMKEETGANLEDIVKAYYISKNIFDISQYYADIESLDFKIDISVQYDMMSTVVRLLRRTTRWMLRNNTGDIDIATLIKRYKKPLHTLLMHAPNLLLGKDKKQYEKRFEELLSVGVPNEVAQKIASTSTLFHALNIIASSEKNKHSLLDVAKVYFTLMDRLDLFWFRYEINQFSSDDEWSVLAKAAYKGDLDWVQSQLTISILNTKVANNSIMNKINVWFDNHLELLEKWYSVASRLRNTDQKEFAMLTVAMRELSDLAKSM